ncbi:serpin family protein [Nocardia sp. CDC159]|uniref:Serpin family protein n=1 Tax=Nocardia pulmonis TaxID=2951408 RepID=A0A9X2EEL5_9NOCA|nr:MULTISPECIES: serpin family protein [Nocardia]MCM6776818.1 serpin family protein [Nocardia pulmonis]MCM6789033.1 serpin family protein [Nocardia sp. CDC159]
MQTSLLPHVAAANSLTGRWCAAAGSDDFVLSGCGAWPLLGILAAAANEPVRSELAAAVGLEGPDAQAAALRLLTELNEAETIAGALGVWVRRDVTVRERWARSLPEGVIETLTDQDALDTWADRHTDGLIRRFPLAIDSETLLVLATAIVARTAWRETFDEDVLEPQDGPWRGHRGPGLSRYSRQLDDVTVLDARSPVTRVAVRGVADLDVHLLLSEGSPGEVLGAGLAALDGSVMARGDLPIGTRAPGLVVRETRAVADTLRIQLPPFEIRSTHRLLDHPDLFGLRSAADDGAQRFPEISETPLYVADAAQNALARFTREGFEAAAVTAIAMARAVALQRPRSALEISVAFDRPFGFLAVHRPTGLVIVAGWVARPPA